MACNDKTAGKAAGPCPDPVLLSACLDGELPSPWKESVEGHLAICEGCSGRIESYKATRAASPAETELEIEVARDRVLQRLDDARDLRRRAIWRRRVSLPIPAAAALAVAIAGLSFAMVLRAPGALEAPPALFVSETDLYVPIADMESVIEYLLGMGGSEAVILMLPEDRSFVSSGDPALIRAADYSKQLASWSAPDRGRN